MDMNYERLKKLWDGRTEYVEDGGMTYRVLTPDGKDKPLFVPLQDSTLYGTVSVRGPEPKGKKPVIVTKTPKRHITKNTDVGG